MVPRLRDILIAAMMLTAAALARPARSAEWYHAKPGYEPSTITIKRHDNARDLEAACGGDSRFIACAFFNTPTCAIHLGPEADNCILRHELKHCAGWGHREKYTGGCGE